MDLFDHWCVELWPICQSSCIGTLRKNWTFCLYGVPRTFDILVSKFLRSSHFSVSNFQTKIKLILLFSYACDDFIINDTSDGKLDRFRSDLVQLRNNPTTLNDKAEPSRSLRPRSSRRRSQSFDSVNGGNNVENRPANKKSRKSAPAHSGISKNSPNSRTRKSSGEALKNLVGLRNLGNTCFMSVVLQSLG